MLQKTLTEQQKHDLHLRAVALGEAKGEMTGYPSKDKPWLKYYSEEAVKADLPDCTMYEYILRQNKDNMSHVALNYYDANITYGRMFEKIDQMAGCLQAAGIGVGEIVSVCMLNSPDTIYLLFALNKIGAVANMLCGMDPSEEILKHLMDVHSTVVFTLDLFQDKFAAIADQTNLKQIVVTNLTAEMAPMTRIAAQWLKGMKPKALPKDGRFAKWKDYFKQTHLDSRTCHNGDAPAVITYTGGTTGGAKGVVLSSNGVSTVAKQGKLVLDTPADSTIMQVLPLFIAFGISSPMMIGLANRLTQIIRIPMSESISEFYKKFKPNYIVHGPAYWEKFADDNLDFDLTTLGMAICSGDMLRVSTEEKINRYFLSHGSPYPLMNGYGMTEVGGAITLSFSEGAHRIGSIGVPFVKVIIAAFDPDTCEELPYGERGELCFCTPSMMIGYLNNEEETRNVIRLHEDGKYWVHSGDLGYVDKDGFIFVSGRIKRFFAHVENGVHKKIFSLDIEKVLLQHPYVANCAVVPIADPKTVQVPVAYVLLKKEYRGKPDMEASLNAYSQERLSASYRPVKYFFVDHFPLTKIGKIDYRALEKEAADQTK